MSEVISIAHREFVYLWYFFDLQLRQIFLYWVIGILIGSCISVFLKRGIHDLFKKINGTAMGMLGIIPASLLGIASPLCMYGTIPLAASVAKSGMRQDWLAAFMMTSVLLNPQLIVYSAALGTKALVTRILTCFLCGITAGVLVRVFCREKEFFDFSGFDEPENRDSDSRIAVRLFKNIMRNIRATGPMFLLGIVLSALFQRYVPENLMTAIFGGDEAWGVLMAATAGVPLYACGGETVPLLRQWLAEGMTLGSAAAFMITGPSTKITNLGALKIVLGMKRFIIYLVFVMLYSFVTGSVINLIF